MTKTLAFLLLFSVIISSCGGDSQIAEQPDNVNLDNSKTVEQTNNINVDDSNETNLIKTYSLKEALESDLIAISADGNGTFRNIRFNIENKSNTSYNLTLSAGIYFENPDKKAQSLITAKKIETITLNDNQKLSFDVASYCTNVNQNVPGLLKNWKYNSNYDGGLDEVIKFYGKYEKYINKWLMKKNENFSDENNRMLFFQTVIWYYEGGQYQDILIMLKNDVFKNDIEKAKVWLDQIHQDASELAKLIKERDPEKIKSWAKEKIKVLVRERLKI